MTSPPRIDRRQRDPYEYDCADCGRHVFTRAPGPLCPVCAWIREAGLSEQEEASVRQRLGAAKP
jgi:hypothetical protein